MRGDVALQLEHGLEHELWQRCERRLRLRAKPKASFRDSHVPVPRFGAEIGAELQLGGARAEIGGTSTQQQYSNTSVSNTVLLVCV